jgi:sugar/nucleoside kinase (ribokinase family)
MITMKNTKPNYLCIGHSCHDKTSNGYILGGTASYSSIAAKQLGMNAAVLTSVGGDFLFHDFFKAKDIDFQWIASKETTVFENIYHNHHRTQYLHSRAETLFPHHIPTSFLDIPIVQFCPIDDEVDFSLLQQFRNALKGATIQGWLRQWDSQGKIAPKAMDWAQLAHVDIVILSDADIAGFEYALPIIANHVKIMVMTQGKNGAIIFTDNTQYHFPSYPIQEVDATGAGDVFAAAFLIQYYKTKRLDLACAYAHVAASFVVEGLGLNNVQAIDNIQARYEAYQAHFLKV